MHIKEPILLILDLDETLIHSSKKELKRLPDCLLNDYYVYRRSHLKEFFLICSEFFELAVWSSGSKDYVNTIVDYIVPSSIKLAFVWDCSRCTTRIDPETGRRFCLKDLKKLKRKGYSLDRVLFVENDPQAVQKHYGNAIYVKSFYGEPDEELRLLDEYLKTVADVPNVRQIEKRTWRCQALNGSFDDGKSDRTIYFFKPNAPYGDLCNFSEHGIEMDGLFYPTVEHYYQAQKFEDAEYQEEIRSAATPHQAKRLSRTASLSIKADWDQIKDEVMFQAVLKKFATHEDARNLLLSTADNLLVEKAPGDYYWGCGYDGTGENKLGKLLCRVRKIIAEKSSDYE